jgi:hypothetical protein
MKKTIIILMAAALTLSACISDLDVTQKSSINKSSMWQTESDVKAAMYGIYNQYRNVYKINMSYWGDFRTGVMGAGLGSYNGTNLANNQLSSSEGKGTNWGSLYTCINDCNMVLKYADNVKYGSEATLNEIKANAYFVRAYCYYTIARVWGDAPIMLEGIESDKDSIYPSRSPQSEVYARVEKDIASAESLMPATVNAKTTASPAAVEMLKTDYYLWKYRRLNGTASDLDAADAACSAVLSNTAYGLLDKYSDVFSVTNKKNKEIIFAIHFEKTTEEFTTYYDDYLIPDSKYTDDIKYRNADSVKTGSEDQWYSFSKSYQSQIYEVKGDTRATTSFKSFTVPETGKTYSWINKFPGEWSDNTRYFTSDIPIYRYDEAILFKAEIENLKGGDALTYLNMIAKRAYGVENYYPAMGQEDMNEAIYNERLKEFTAEAKTWWDTIRMGYAFTKIPSLRGRQNEANILLWPISSDCFEENPNIRQTVGYN